MRRPAIIQHQIVRLVVIDRRVRNIVDQAANRLRSRRLEELGLERADVRGVRGVAEVGALPVPEARRLDEPVRRLVDRGVRGERVARVTLEYFERGENDRAGTRRDGREDPELVAIRDILRRDDEGISTARGSAGSRGDALRACAAARCSSRGPQC